MNKLNIFGIEYFRPPNPPAENWAADLKQIVALGFNTIRCWLYWRTVEPEEGHWDFSAYDRLFQLAAKNRLRVLVTLIAEAPPEWALRKLPGSILVGADGKQVQIVPTGMVAVGGYPGLCLDEPNAKKLAGRFLAETAQRFGAHRALAGFALQNEVMPFYQMSGTSVNHPCQHGMFRDFLGRRYATVRQYNKVHLTSLKSFDEAEIQARALPPDGLDRVQFCAERVFAQLKWRRDLVRKNAPKAMLFCHGAGGAEAVTKVPWVQEDIAGLVNSWGTSNYENNAWMQLLSAVVTRSAAAGKPWGLVEMTGGTMWTHYPTTARSPEEIVSLPLLFMAQGATTNLFWQYRPERIGTESPNFGLVMETGRQPLRARAVGRLGNALKTNQKLYAGLKWRAPRIAFVVDWHGFAYEEGLGAGNLSSTRMQELAGLNGALAVAGFEVDALSSAHWEKQGLPKSIKLLILPNNIVLTKDMLQRLQQASAAGVSVLAGPMVGHFTGDGWLRTQAEFKWLERFFGAVRCDVTTAEKFALKSPVAVVNGAQFCEEYELAGARPWLRTETGKICGTRYKTGRSIRWRYGSLLGKMFNQASSSRVTGGVVADQPSVAAARAGIDPALPTLLRTAAAEAGITPDHPMQGNFIIRVGRSGEKAVAFIRNVTEFECLFQPPAHWRWAAPLDGESSVTPKQALRFAPQQTRVIQIKRLK